MNIYGVAGRPVLHSKSPLLHAHLSKISESPYVRVAADSVDELTALIRNAGFRGWNVTSPFKRSLLPFLDGLDISAADIGAVNTVVNKGGRWIGHNTDPEGVLFPLRRRGIRVKGLRCLVLGAGGAGRAAVAALVRHGGRVTVVNRTEAKAKSCGAAFGCSWKSFRSWSKDLGDFDLLINTVPLPAARVEAVIPPAGLVVLDGLYQSRPFSFLAGRRDCVYIPGEEWLFGQAMGSHRLWNGGEPEAAEPPGALFEPLFSRKKIRRVSLVGFMGSGKSTVGCLLARKLNLTFLETDALIAEGEGMSVREIFRRRGEDAFRSAESRAVERALGAPSAVLALGGGAVIRRANRAALAKNSLVVWLHVRPETAFARTAGSDRPLLAARPGREAFQNLWEKRLQGYAAAADLMAWGEKSAEKVAGLIHEEIHRLLQN